MKYPKEILVKDYFEVHDYYSKIYGENKTIILMQVGSFHECYCVDKKKGLNLIKGKIRLWIGVTYDISNYRFRNNNVRLTPNTDEFNFILQDPSVEQADKSKLVTNYLGIPVLLGFQNHAQNPTFKISVGAQAGYLVRSHTKYRTENGNKTKKFDDFNMSDISVHPVFNLTWESFTFYAKYALTNLFKKEQGLDQKNMILLKAN